MAPSVRLSDGNDIPQIGFGVAGIREPGATTKMVGAALKAGYAMIDNASIYENEDEVGVALEASPTKRADVFLTSKVWPDMYGHDKVLQSFEESAARLKTDYLDLFLLHWPSPALDMYVESWQALIELKDQRKVRSIGVSNFFPDQLQRLIDETGVTPVINQIECHPYFQRVEERAFHATHNIATECWSPLGRSTCLDDSVIVAVAQEANCTPAQVVLRWAMDQALIVIPRSRSIERMQQNFAIESVSLSADHIARINGLDKGNDGKLGPDPDIAR